MGVHDLSTAHRIAHELVGNSTLFEFNISHNQLVIEEDFPRALRDNSTLAVLKLGGNFISLSGLSGFVTLLGRNTTLTELDLSSTIPEVNFVRQVVPDFIRGSGEERDRAMGALSLVLTENSTLTKLSLDSYEFGSAVTEQLGLALRVNSGLRELSLRRNCIRDAEMTPLTSALHVNTVLMRLDLGENFLSNTCVELLGRALQGNTTLTELRVNQQIYDPLRPNITDEGAGLLALALTRNTTLQALFLGWNRIGDIGVRQLTAALACHPSLSRLDLSRCLNLEPASVTAIGDMLVNHSVLTELNLDRSTYAGDMGEIGGQLATNAGLLARNRTNMLLRGKSLFGALMEGFENRVFESYTQEEKARVYFQIWQLTDTASNDPQFGEHNIYVVDRSVFLRAIANAG
ncbi:MAG: hypothetical protein V4492_09175, partial [Chlamydiota bacterium]